MLRNIKPHEIHQGTLCTVLGHLVTSSVIPCQNNLCVITHARRDPAETHLDVTSSPAHISCGTTIRIPIAQLHISSSLIPSVLLVRNKFPSTSQRIQMRQRLMVPLLSVCASNIFAVRITDLQHVAWSHCDDYYTDPSRFEANNKLDGRNTF